CLQSLRSIRARDVDRTLVSRASHADPPGIAANLAILYKAPSNVFLDEDFDLLAAVGARHEEFIRHDGPSYHRQHSGAYGCTDSNWHHRRFRAGVSLALRHERG